MKKDPRSQEIGAMFSLFWIIFSLLTYKEMWLGMKDKATWMQIIFVIVYLIGIVMSIKEIRKAFFQKTSD